MANKDYIVDVGEKSISLQKTSTNYDKTVKLGTDIADIVVKNQQYMTNMMKLQIQQDQLVQVNKWMELQHDIEVKNIEERTGQLISNQTASYAYSGVTMSGSALEATLRQAEEGAKEKIYSDINFAYGQIQREYQGELNRIAKKSEKRAQTASMIGSITSAIGSVASSTGSYGGGK